MNQVAERSERHDVWAIMPTPVRIHAAALLMALVIPLTAMGEQAAGGPLQVSMRRALPVEEPPPPLDAASLPENRKAVYNHCETKQPVVAVTFDDGPDPVLTPRLLDLLKERGIHATFFLVGQNVAAQPAIVQRIVAEGHEVANHSWSHPLLTSLKEQSVESQLRRTHDAIVAACGVAPLLYRPPYGAIRLSQRTKIEQSFGYAAILWDVDPEDWKKPRTAQKVYDRVLAQTKPGSIILCHDIHEPTVAAMPAVLDDLKGRGYAFATVTQLIALTTPPPPAEIAKNTEAQPATTPAEGKAVEGKPVGTSAAPAAAVPETTKQPAVKLADPATQPVVTPVPEKAK
jgi:peptidoglycan-N-acetylglucosamine deacetylase